MPMMRVLFLFLAACGLIHQASAQSLVLENLVFVSPATPTNVVNLTLATSIGTDSDATTVSGFVSAILDYQLHGTNVIPTGLTFTGGAIALSDVSFSYVFNTVQIQTNDVSGYPSTPNPPSPVTMSQFDAADHVITFNQGTITGPSTSLNLADDSIPATGSGTGVVQVTSTGGPTGSSYPFDITITLPIQINESFVIPDVPIFGTVNATLTGSGNAVSRQHVDIDIVPGDFNGDLLLSCADLLLLEDAVSMSSMNLTFDTNLDGVVDSHDILFWLNDLRGALAGDANLDNVVDANDFLVWNMHKFTPTSGWCSADFDLNGLVDGADFILWNMNKFTSADGTAVPEPSTLAWLLALLLFRNTSRR